MKKFLICAVLGLAVSSAQAVVTPAPKSAAPAAKTKQVQSGIDVIGVWVSHDRGTVVAPGTMTLTKDGKVTLAPEGFDPLHGTLKVEGQFLDITTDRGRATLIYRVTKNTMSVEYENGSVQNFTKQLPTAAGAAVLAKKKEK